MEVKDMYSTCGAGHHHSNCNAYHTYFCISCKSSFHSSSDKECPEYKSQLKALNACNSENQMPYFPMEEIWTQAILPSKPTGPIILSHPPTFNTVVLQQHTLNWMQNQQTEKTQQPSTDSVINSRTLVSLGQHKPNCTPTQLREANTANTPNPAPAVNIECLCTSYCLM